MLDDVSLGDGLGKCDAIFVIKHSCKDFVGIAVEQSNECDPFLLFVLEFDHVTFKTDGTFLGDFKLGAEGVNFVVKQRQEFLTLLIHFALGGVRLQRFFQFLFAKFCQFI